MSSEPTWLADGQTFSYDVDTKHMGVFSTAENRMRVLPEVTLKPLVTSFRFVSGNSVFVASVVESTETELTGISVPSMEELVRFRLPGLALDLRPAGSVFYATNFTAGHRTEFTELDMSNKQARRLGHVPGQGIRYPIFAGGRGGVCQHTSAIDGGHSAPWWWRARLDRRREHVAVARCGADLVVSRQVDDRTVVERVDLDGRPPRRSRRVRGMSILSVLRMARWFSSCGTKCRARASCVAITMDAEVSGIGQQ